MTALVMRIEYQITNDDPFDGNPILPGIITDGEFWSVVAHLPGRRTRWRRISISSFPAADRRAAPGGQNKSAIRQGVIRMDMRKYSGETFIKVDDVRNSSIRVQIAVVKEGKYDRPNLVFETGEVLGLNSTNNRTLMRAYGPNSDDWVGKEIELYLGEIEYDGSMQPAVLVRPISPSIAAKERAAAAKKLGDEMDDQLPY